jgi:predicted NAD/FAD-binding protein
MVGDVLRFNKEAESILASCDDRTTLGVLLETRGYSQPFIDLYIVPMGAAIWSTDPTRMLSFPAWTFVRFLVNHGLTSLVDRPTWRVVEGGSRQYVERLIDSFRERIHLECPVQRISRHERGVDVTVRGRPPELFDRVVIATHSDQALRMLGDPSDAEREILGAIRYQSNEAALHTDDSLLPRSRRAWASWNYRVPAGNHDRVAVTYDMNELQGIEDAPVRFCVSLNASDRVDPTKVLYRRTYHHPLFTAESVAAQRRLDEISGQRHTYYCGAYWRYGFHEDGVVSALAVARKLGITWAGSPQTSLNRASEAA